jgi:Zn-dependent protease/predicted transcriptional regulator
VDRIQTQESEMTGAWTLGRLLGVPIGVHPTWLIAFVLIAWSLATGFFADTYPGWAPGAYWAAGVGAALLLFVSVLLHELSHAVVARARGLSVVGITLFVFGGVALIDGDREDPGDELLVAAVGPLTSFVLAGIAWLGLVASGPGGLVQALLFHLALANALLGAFNLVPAFPLDGGRILRALLWSASGNLRTATDVASYAGQGLAVALVVVGLLGLLGGEPLGGLWTVFIGWFLFGAARHARGQVVLRDALRGVRVADLMTPAPRTVSPLMRLDEFVHEEVIRRGHRALPVVDGDRFVGVVTLSDAEKTPHDRWPFVAVGTVATTRDLTTVAPRDAVDRALTSMAERGLNQVPVVQDGALVGLLTGAGVARFVALHRGLGLPARRPPPQPAGTRHHS